MEEDPEGKTIVYYFDEKGRLTAEKNQLVVNENEYSSKKEYDGQNHITKVTDARNYASNFEYDGNHNVTKIKNALLKETNMKYDSQFRLTDTIDPLLHGGHVDYDTEHHPTLSKYGVLYDGSFTPIDNGLSQTSAAYYANGFTNTATDGRSTTTTLTYDAYGNPYTAKTAAHPVLTTVYNSKGWLTSLTDQVNATSTFDQYNNRGQLKLKTDPLLKQTSFTYYDNGNLWTRKDRNNNTITYTYTPTDKVDTITYPDTSTVHFVYDNNDSLTSMQDSLVKNKKGTVLFY